MAWVNSPKEATMPEQVPVSGTGEERIVVGTDGSPCASRAVDFAAHEAARRDALLHIVTAYCEVPAASRAVYQTGLNELSANAVVSTAMSRAEELEPSIVTKGEAFLDGAGHGLTEASKGATALVVGTRGHNQVAGLLVGSVSEYVLHHASCTTIVVR
jgi:nucleotide-binding universal stress UspA family protein